mmetsp:Transcript_25575/g.78844  ORF Transcript_25575/g.78844 Transcript_25575/m.78844 type:complete len:317 (-) Transcript_25575:26-976(-)
MSKAPKTEPRQAFESTVEPFAVTEVLQFNSGGHAVLLGEIAGSPALLQITQKAAHADADALRAALPTLALSLTNYSGAEYSYYVATDEKGVAYDVEAIWPASERQVQRKRPGEIAVFEETAEAYSSVVQPFATAQAAKIGWIDAVCSLEKERERNLYDCDDFVINVDTKWTTHGPFDADKTTWPAAPWTRDLYLLAISKDAKLASLRDLRGPEGARLVRAMRDALRKTASDVYGVPASKLRVFFHYQPQFYRLHAHCTRAEHTNPGCECDRAHLLSTVANHLDRWPDYYAEATLTYKLRVGEKLHGLLDAAGLLAA